MSSLKDMPSDISQHGLVKVLRRLGFDINRRGGNGSHYKATWPPTQKSVTIQSKLHKVIVKSLLKQLELATGGKITALHILDELR